MKAQSLYLHIPFCDHLCSYCDFPKVLTSVYDRKEYLQALFREIDSFQIERGSLKTIYVGGGTPSALALPELEFLLQGLLDRFGKVEEFTIECNPESLSKEKARLFSRFLVNRVSLGVESVSPRLLALYQRHHTLDDVRDAVSYLRAYNIDNINLDFIYGLGDGTKEIDEDIDFALSLDPTHLSFYSLQIEDGTLLKRRKVTVEEDHLREEYDYLVARLEKEGYARYEVSNFARKGWESRHNLVYWHDQEYYGCGLGASGFLFPKRYKNTLSMPSYLRGENAREIEIVDKESHKIEYLMLHLRLVDGFSLDDYQEVFQEDFLKTHQKGISSVSDMVEIVGERFRIKKEDLYVMDHVLLALI